MFPLENPLLPGEVVPLRIFEDRYLRLLADLDRTESPRIGVVLIHHGREVGGGDDRFDVGCMAEVVDLTVSPQHESAMVIVGRVRLDIERWLPEDPYPQAEVHLRELDETTAEDHWTMIGNLAATVEQIHGLLDELGADLSGVDRRLPDDVAAAAWRLTTLMPLGPFDRQQVLEAAGTVERLGLLRRYSEEIHRHLELQRSAW